jgi:hypothetical protein
MVRRDVVPQPLVPFVVVCAGTVITLITGSHGQFFPEDRVNWVALWRRGISHRAPSM